MSLQFEYERLYQRNEIQSVHNIILKNVRYPIKSMYPEKKFLSTIDEHVKKMFHKVVNVNTG